MHLSKIFPIINNFINEWAIIARLNSNLINLANYVSYLRSVSFMCFVYKLSKNPFLNNMV